MELFTKDDFTDYDRELLELYSDFDFEIHGLRLDMSENNSMFTECLINKDYKAAYKLLPLNDVSKELQKKAAELFKPYISNAYKITKTKSKRNEHVDFDNVGAITAKLNKDITSAKPNLVALEDKIDYKTVHAIINELYHTYKKRVFIISNEVKLSGQIVSSIDSSVELILSEKYRKLVNPKEKDVYVEKLFCFGDSMKEYRGPTKVQNSAHTELFYRYQFIDSTNCEYIIYSMKQLDRIGLCTITGMRIDIDDKRRLGEDANVYIKQPILFISGIEYDIKTYSKKQLEKVRLNHDWDSLKLAYFGRYKHPDWFIRMMIAQSYVLRENGSPLHVLVLAQASTYKTSGILKCLNIAYNESTPIVSGNSATIAGLTVSHRETPPKIGALFKFERCSLVDELLQLLRNSVKNGQDSDEFLGRMTTILDHMKFSSPSGNGNIILQLNTRCIFTTNPPVTTRDYTIIELASKINNPFLSRLLVYRMTKNHVDQMRSLETDIIKYKEDMYPKNNPEIASLIDTLARIDVDYDAHKILKIKKDIAKYVPDELLELYNARHIYHITNVLCGVTKLNWLIDKSRDDFVAQDIDYTQTKEIVETCVLSWISDVDINTIDITSRANYLPQFEANIYRYIESKRKVSLGEIVNAFDDDKRVSRMVRYLEYIKLIKCLHDDVYAPHWYTGRVSVNKRIGEYSARDILNIDDFSDDEIAGLSKDGLIVEFQTGIWKVV